MNYESRLYEKPYESLRQNYQTIKRTYRKLMRELSRLDKQVSALYHELEKTDLSEELGYQYSIALQNLLRRRRVVKDEMIPFEIMKRELDKAFPVLEEHINRNRMKSESIRTSLNVSIRIDEVVEI